ncbi:MAG: hypothetical protein ABI040_10245 [Rhodoferax sp.]
MTEPLGRILIADDEADLRALLQRYLGDQTANTATPRCKNRVTRSSRFGEAVAITVTFFMTTILRPLMEGATCMVRRRQVACKLKLRGVIASKTTSSSEADYQL